MKTLHTILTVVFWLLVAHSIFMLITNMPMVLKNARGFSVVWGTIGLLIGYSILPAIAWGFKQFVAKKIAK
jgi:hypothetical protein